jgi:hypothetical protein
MKTMKLAFPFNPTLLQKSLAAAGIPIVTIRAILAAPTDAVCVAGVLVFPATYDPTSAANAASIQAVLTAHKADPAVAGKSPSPSKVDVNTVLSAMAAVQ